jgi:hypothetical protein
MKRFFIAFILLQFFATIALADDYEIQNKVINIINESIEWIFVNGYSVRLVPRESIIVNSLDEIFINIYFRAGVYESRDDINNVIENKLLIELENEFQDNAIYISTFYPFSLILANNLNYEFDERQDIINELRGNAHGIIVENIFQNSIYGYIQDRYFTNTFGIGEMIINQSLYNNIIPFLENVSRYFDGENIISY